MATITSLGFSIFSRYDGTGVRQARRDLRNLKNDLDAANDANVRLTDSTRALRKEHDALSVSARRVANDLNTARGAATNYTNSMRSAQAVTTSHRNAVDRMSTSMADLDAGFRSASGGAFNFRGNTAASRDALIGFNRQSDYARGSVGGLTAAFDRASASARAHAAASDTVTHSHQTMTGQIRAASQAMVGLGNNSDSARNHIGGLGAAARAAAGSNTTYSTSANTAAARSRALGDSAGRAGAGMVGAGNGGNRGATGIRNFGNAANRSTIYLGGMRVSTGLVMAGVSALTPIVIHATGVLLAAGAAGITAGIGLGAFFLALKKDKKGVPILFDDMKTALDKWQTSLESVVKVPIAAWTKVFGKILQWLTPMVDATAGALTTLAQYLQATIKPGGDFANSWTTIAGAIQPVIGGLGRALINFLIGILNVTAALIRGGLVQSFVNWMEKASLAFRDWSAHLDKNKGFQEFLNRVRADGPIVGQFFKALWQALIQVLRATDGLGQPLLKLATIFLQLIANTPVPVLQALIVAFTLWKTVLGPVSTIISGVGKALTALRFIAFAFEISLSSMVLIVLAVIVALVALGVGIYYLVKNWDTVSAALKTAWNATWNFMKMVALAVWNALKVAWNTVAQSFVALWQVVSTGLVTAWTVTWNAIKLAAVTVWNALKFAWNAVVSGFGIAWTAVSSAFSVAWTVTWNAIKLAAVTVWNALQFAWNAFITGLQIIWTTVSTALVIAWNTVWNAIGVAARTVWTGLQFAWNGFITGLQLIWTTVSGALQIAWSTVWNAMRAVATTIWAGLQVAWTAVWNAIRAVGQAIWTGIQVAWQAFVNAMRTIFNVGIGAIRDSWNVVWGAIRTAGQAIWSALQTAWNAFWSFMRNAFNVGMAAIRDSWNVVWNAIKAAGQAIWNALQAAWNAFWSFMRNAFNIGMAAIRDSWNVVWGAIRTAGQVIWNALGAAWSAFWSFMRNAFNIGLGAIHNSWNVIWNAIKAAGTAVWNALGAAWGVLWAFMRNAFNGAMTALRNSWNIAWNALKAFTQAVWNALGAAWGVLWTFIRNAFNGAMTALRNSWNIAWNALKAFTESLWNALGAAWGVLWAFFRNAFNGAMNALSSSWHNAWEALKNFTTALWDFLGKKFGEWKSFMVKATDDAVHLIGQAWHEIENLFKAPIRFVIETVINGGVIGALNWVLEKLGFSPNSIKTFGLPKGFSHGGQVKGKGTKTSDSIPARLSKDEYVIRAASAQDIGYGNLAYMNKHGKLPGGGTPGMCTGGKMDAGHFIGADSGYCAGGKICGGKVVGNAPGYAFGGQVQPWPDIAGPDMNSLFKPTKSSAWDAFLGFIDDFFLGGAGIIDPQDAVTPEPLTRALNAAFNVASLGSVKGAAGLSNLAKMIAPDSKLAQFIVKSKLKAVTKPEEPLIFSFFGEDLQGGVAGANKVVDFVDKQVDKIPASARGFGMSYSTKMWRDLAHKVINGPNGANAGKDTVAGQLNQANQDIASAVRDQANAASGTRTEGGNSTKGFNGLRQPFTQMFAGFFNQIPSGGAAGFRPFRAWRNGDDVHTNWKGCTVNVRTRDMLNAAEKLLGSGMSCYQGSFSSSVGASAGTHSGGGAVDAGPPTMDTVGAMRASGFAAWLRTQKEGFSPHVHGIAVGDPTVSPQAKEQVDQFFKGQNGLANHGPDTYIPTAKFIKYVVGGAGVAGNCARWQPLAAQALAMAGINPGELGDFMSLMNSESSCNPSSINTTDINAQRGDPSRGLMQVIGSTFAAFHCPGTSGNIFDPLANMCASARYIKNRYGGNVPAHGPYGLGSPGATKGWHLVGEMGPEMVHFRGGERVENWRNLKDAIHRGGGHGDVHVEMPITVHGNLDHGAVDRLETKVVPKMRMMLMQQIGRNG